MESTLLHYRDKSLRDATKNPGEGDGSSSACVLADRCLVCTIGNNSDTPGGHSEEIKNCLSVGTGSGRAPTEKGRQALLEVLVCVCILRSWKAGWKAVSGPWVNCMGCLAWPLEVAGWPAGTTGVPRAGAWLVFLGAGYLSLPLVCKRLSF